MARANAALARTSVPAVQMLGFNDVAFAVRPAAAAGDEDEFGGADAGHVEGVVAGAGAHAGAGIAEGGGGLFGERDGVLMEVDRRALAADQGVEDQAGFGGDAGLGFVDLAGHGGGTVFVRVDDAVAEGGAVGDIDAVVGPAIDHHGTGGTGGGVGEADAVDGVDQFRGTHQRVAAAAHGHGLDVGVLAQHFHVGEDRVVAVGDGADGDAGFLEQGALFDVQFEIGVDFAAADRGAPVVADAAEFVAEAASTAVGGGMGFGQGKGTGEDGGAHQAGGEAGAFLVGPVHHFERAAGGDAGFGDAAHGLQRAEHAKGAVELAAGGLGVEMAAEHLTDKGIATFKADWEKARKEMAVAR